MTYTYMDGPALRRNEITCFGSGGPAYNAVLRVQKSEELTGAGPVTEPVTLQEAKDWCRIDVSEDDDLITALITAARMVCEDYVNLGFIGREVTANIHNGLGNFTLPYGPVTSQIIDVDSNIVDPVTAFDDDVSVTYTAGFVILPKNLKKAMLNQIAFMYTHRGDVELASNISVAARLILYPLRNV